MPKRIRRQRTKGWKMPEGAVYVGRGSRWGNPFRVGEPCGVFKKGQGMGGRAETLIPELSLEQVIEFYRNAVSGMLGPEMYPQGHEWRDAFLQKSHNWWPSDAAKGLLRGKDLACWCPLDQPCHADVLLEIANAF